MPATPDVAKHPISTGEHISLLRSHLKQYLADNSIPLGSKKARMAEDAFLQGIISYEMIRGEETPYLVICKLSGRSILDVAQF